MIRLRRQLERGIRHPLFGPLLVLVLLVLLVMTAMHESHESLAGHPGEFCVALAALLGVLCLIVRLVVFATVVVSILVRGPPAPTPVMSTVGCVRPRLLSLRL